MEKDQAKGLAYQILDLSEQALFVFSKDDFRIIYANPKAKTIFGDRMVSLTCFEGVETKQTPCLDCPFLGRRVRNILQIVIWNLLI